MHHTIGACGIAAACALLLTGCGGEGGGGADGLSLSPKAIDVTASTIDYAPPASVVGTARPAPANPIYVYVQHGDTIVQWAGVEPLSDNSARLHLALRTPDTLGPGIYQDTLVVSVCNDPYCASHVAGSPKNLPVTYRITGDPVPPPEAELAAAQAAPDAGALPVSATQPLGYSVADAEYSKSLDAIVMVSDALHLYDGATGTEQSIALAPGATSVSVSPDGDMAYVGHWTGGVSQVDLTRLDDPLYTPQYVAVNAPIGDVVADGYGWAHAFPAEDQWVSVYSVNTQSGSVVPAFSVYEDMIARLNPRGTSLYGATTQLSPADIYRFRNRSGTLTDSRDSPYHGDYNMCGNLFFSAEGQRIYTACGRTFRSSDFPSQDMTYMGLLGKHGSAPIVSLDDWPQVGLFAAVEAVENRFKSDCGYYYQCSGRLTLFERETAAPLASYLVGEGVPRHAFFSQDGTKIFVITWLYPGATYKVLTFEVDAG